MKPPVYNAAWSDEVKAIYNHDMREIWDRSLSPNIWNQYHNQLSLYAQLARGRTPLDILDVGCAQGTLALKLAEQGHRVTAMDIRQPFLDYAKSRYERGVITFLCGNALEDSPIGNFDLIYANQIIEHLVYPLEFVNRIASWLKPGGRVVLTTPNGLYFKNSLPSFSQINPTESEHLQFTADADGHFFAYLPEELVRIASAAMLTDVTVTPFESPWISGHVKVRYIHGWCPAPILAAFDKFFLRLPNIGPRIAHQLMVIGKKL